MNISSVRSNNTSQAWCCSPGEELYCRTRPKRRLCSPWRHHKKACQLKPLWFCSPWGEQNHHSSFRRRHWYDFRQRGAFRDLMAGDKHWNSPFIPEGMYNTSPLNLAHNTCQGSGSLHLGLLASGLYVCFLAIDQWLTTSDSLWPTYDPPDMGLPININSECMI